MTLQLPLFLLKLFIYSFHFSIKKDCVIAKMNKYGYSDQGQTWDQAVKIANRYCRDSDSSKKASPALPTPTPTQTP